jgi:hypothetical protein
MQALCLTFHHLDRAGAAPPHPHIKPELVELYLHSSQPRTTAELDLAITDALNQVTKADILGWFAESDANTVLIGSRPY